MKVYDQKDISHFFKDEILDVYAIKKEVSNRNVRIDKRPLERMYAEIVKSSRNFVDWSQEEILRNAVLVAVLLVKNGLKTNQIRRILEIANQTHLKLKTRNVESIEADTVKMRYLLAYAVARSSSKERGTEYLHRILDPILQNTTKDNFEKFYEFLQAVVAYHKFFGGREE